MKWMSSLGIWLACASLAIIPYLDNGRREGGGRERGGDVESEARQGKAGSIWGSSPVSVLSG